MQKLIRINVNTYWFGLLEKGEINFDYREVKPHWTSRFANCNRNETDIDIINRNIKDYDTVEFFIPYTQKSLTFEIKSIMAYTGDVIGLKCDACYIIMLGKRLK